MVLVVIVVSLGSPAEDGTDVGDCSTGWGPAALSERRRIWLAKDESPDPVVSLGLHDQLPLLRERAVVSIDRARSEGYK
jgi:hypothetical protein